MGATDEELNNVKSDKDLENLINNLASRLYGNGGGVALPEAVAPPLTLVPVAP